MDTFLEKVQCSKIGTKREDLNNLINIESVTKNLPTRKLEAQMASAENSTLHLRKNNAMLTQTFP